MKTALLIFSGILSFLFPVLCQDSSFPGSGMYMGRECSSPSIVMQYQPDTCMHSSSGLYYHETCNSTHRTSKTCRDSECRSCEFISVQPLSCHTSGMGWASNICGKLIEVPRDSVIGTIYEYNRCQGRPKAFIRVNAAADACIEDFKLFCDRNSSRIIYEKYRLKGCQGPLEIRKERIKCQKKSTKRSSFFWK